MSGLVAGFALCAAIFIYPGGATLVLAAGCARGAFAGLSRLAPVERSGGRTITVGAAGAALLAIGLGSAAVLPLPWPGDPAGRLTLIPSQSLEVGGSALTVAALWCLAGLRRGPHPQLQLWLLGGWTLGVVLMAVALRDPSWSGLLRAGGGGAEAARVALALLLLGTLLSEVPFGTDLLGQEAVGWVCRAAVALWLLLPGLGSHGPLAAVAALCLACAGSAATVTALRRRGWVTSV